MWLWLYAFGVVLVKLAARFGIWFRRFSGPLDIDEKPIRIVGFCAVVIVTGLYVLASPFVLLYALT